MIYFSIFWVTGWGQAPYITTARISILSISINFYWCSWPHAFPRHLSPCWIFFVDTWPATIQGETCSDERSTWHLTNPDQLNSIDNHPGSCQWPFRVFLSDHFRGEVTSICVIKRSLGRIWIWTLVKFTWVMHAPYTFKFNKQPLPSLCTGQMENLVQTVQTCTATSSKARRAPQFPGDQSTRANRKRLTSEIGHILKPWKLAWNLKIT